MNKQKRKAIHNAINSLESTKRKIVEGDDGVLNMLLRIYNNVEFIFDQEENVMDNFPENMQSGSRYEKIEAACDHLQDALDSIGDATRCLEDNVEAIKCIDEAIDYLAQASV